MFNRLTLRLRKKIAIGNCQIFRFCCFAHFFCFKIMFYRLITFYTFLKIPFPAMVVMKYVYEKSLQIFYKPCKKVVTLFSYVFHGYTMLYRVTHKRCNFNDECRAFIKSYFYNLKALQQFIDSIYF